MTSSHLSSSHQDAKSPPHVINFLSFPRVAIATLPYQPEGKDFQELTFQKGEYFIIHEEMETGYCWATLLGKGPLEATVPASSADADQQPQQDNDSTSPPHSSPALSQFLHQKLHQVTHSNQDPTGYVSLYYINYVKHLLDPSRFSASDNEYEAYYRYHTDTICNKCRAKLTPFQLKWHTWDMKMDANCDKEEEQLDWCCPRINYCDSCYQELTQDCCSSSVAQKQKKLIEHCNNGEDFLRRDAYFFSWRRHPLEVKYLLVASSTAQTLYNALKYHSERRLYGWRRQTSGDSTDGSQNTCSADSLPEWITYEEVRCKVYSFARGLSAMIRKQSHRNDTPWTVENRPLVGICSINRVEWFIADLACLLYGMISVPLQRTKVLIRDTSDILYMINHSQLEVIVTERKYIRTYMLLCKEHCPSVKIVVQMEDWTSGEKEQLQEVLDKEDLSCSSPNPSPLLFSMDEIESLGKSEALPPLDLMHLQPDDLLTIVFTSGSTNQPKGVIVTERNMLDLLRESRYELYHPLVDLTFHPLSHISDRQSALLLLLAGGQLAIYSGHMDRIFEDFALFEPIIVSSTPRLFLHLYSEYQKALYAGSLLHGGSKKLHSSLHEQQVKQKFKPVLGNRIQGITLGGAATPKHIISFAKKCFDVPVYHGYASTEAGSIQWMEESSNYFTSSFKKSDAEVKLIDCPECNYWTSSTPAQGEICVKSAQVFSGYYKNEEHTRRAFTDDGFFKTGDIGERSGPNGSIRIIDRKNNITKLSQGEFIVIARLEEIFRTSPYVHQIFIYGDSMHSFPVAVVICDDDVVKEWLRDEGFSESEVTFLSAIGTPTAPRSEDQIHIEEKLKLTILKDFNRIGIECKLQPWEIPRGILLDSEPFTCENNRLTGLGKTCVPELKRHYKSLLMELYEDLEQQSPEDMLISALAAVLNLDTSDSNSDISRHSFLDLGGDSLTAVRVNSIMGKHGFQIPTNLLLRENLSLSDLKQYIAQLSSVDLDMEIKLNPEFTVHGMNPPKSLSELSRKAKFIFLTGVTGFLGSFLLENILKEYPHIQTVYCLTRVDEKQTEQKLMRILQDRKVSSSDAQTWMKMVEFVKGDLASPHLGLSEQDWNRLASSVEIVYHNGAQVNHVFHYSDLKDVNVNGTLEVLRLCGEKKVKPLHFVSSTGVLNGKADGGLMPKDEALHTLQGYNLSKYVCEWLLETARREREFPVTIYRPEYVFADAHTGYGNTRDWLTQFVRACVHLKCYPVVGLIQGIPVDFCCASLVRLSIEDENNNQTIHLVHPDSKNGFVSSKELFSIIGEEFAMEGVEQATWLNRLQSSEVEGLWKSFFAEGVPLITHPVEYSPRTLEIMQNQEHFEKCESLQNRELISKYVLWLKEKKLL